MKTRTILLLSITSLVLAGAAGVGLVGCAVVSEHAYHPGMRAPLMTVLRNPERGPLLSDVVGRFFQYVTGHPQTD